MSPRSWTIPGADGRVILGDTHLPDDGCQPAGDLIICHGFKGYKDYGFFPLLAQVAAEHGLAAHRFNFSHSGMTNQLATFERPDLFEADTWGKQIHDLGCVSRTAAAGRLSSNRRSPSTQPLPQVVFGHSRGGVTTLLTAGRQFRPQDYRHRAGDSTPLAQDPAGLVLGATPHGSCSLDDDQRRLLRSQRWLESPSSRTGQKLRLGGAWLAEMEASPADFDVLAAAQRVTCPVLILHGDGDTTVNVDSAHRLASAIPRAELQIIPGASHTFDAANPLQTPTAGTRSMIHAAVAFALQCCGKTGTPVAGQFCPPQRA